MKNREYIGFRNKKLIRKLIISIILIIIIPLMLIGIFLSIYMTTTVKKNLCDKKLEIVESISVNITDYFKRIEEFSVEAGESNSAARVMKNSAFLTDYVTVKQWLDGLMKNNEDYKNISLSNGGKIYMQMGTYIESEDEIALSELMKENKEDIWTLPRKLKISPHALTKSYSKDVLTYYSRISEYYNWNQEHAVISVSVGEEELCKRYTDYLGSDYLECFLVRQDGKILSATDKSKLGKTYGEHQKIMDRLQENNYGYWKAEGKYYFYAYCEPMKLYVVESVAGTSIDIAVRPVWIIIIVALILCIVFGVVFAYVQHYYIILPLNQLLENIQHVKNGNFDIKKQKFNEDEIGKLNQEFLDMSMQLQKMLKEVYISKINEQEAEIQVLLSQINPHFLYNTLDSIHWRAVKCKAYDVADQIEALSEMYKYSLSKGRKMISLKEELVFLDNYFFIMKARYEKRIEFRVFVDEKYETIDIPKLILQPLIENAVFHGLEPLNTGGCVCIEARRQGGELVVSVEDNGIGTDGETLMEKIRSQANDGEALALKNIDMRMRLHYGKEYGILLESRQGEGCRVILRIPCNV